MRCCNHLLLVSLVVVGLLCRTMATAQSPSENSQSELLDGQEAVDCIGDSLPEGAVCRLGTTRLRTAGTVNGVAFAPDSKAVLSASWTDDVRLWDVASGKLVRRFTAVESDQGNFAAVYSPDGSFVAGVSQNGYVRMWLASDSELLWEKQGHFENDFGTRVYGVAFSPDGSMLATGGGDPAIHVWDTATGAELLTLETEQGVAIRGPLPSRPMAICSLRAIEVATSGSGIFRVAAR